MDNEELLREIRDLLMDILCELKTMRGMNRLEVLKDRLDRDGGSMFWR